MFSQQITQAVIATAGDVSTTGKMMVEWTLGEPVIETIVTKDLVFTQGFHQPVLRGKSRPVTLPVQQERIRVTVWPNPVQQFCRAFIERDSETNLYLLLTDALGRPLCHKISASKLDAVMFDLTGYASGVYTLTVTNANGDIYQSFKVIKAN